MKERCQYEAWVNEYFGLPDKFPEQAISMDFDYGQIVNMLAMFDQKRNGFHKQNVADVMFERDLENTNAKEIISDLLPLAENGLSGRSSHLRSIQEAKIEKAKQFLK